MGSEGCTALDFIIDLCFAGGFGFLAFWWIFAVSHKETNPPSTMETAVLCGYYIFFSLFMLASAFKISYVHEPCGFLRHPLYKSLFYLMLATFALPDL